MNLSIHPIAASSRAAAPDPVRLPVRTPAAPALPPSTSIRAYYAPAQGRQGVDLLRSLHELSEDKHVTLSYLDARMALFEHVEDLDGDNVVTDLYSGRTIANVSGLAAATKAGLTTEHVWPQSEGATKDARSDLHHLRPALRALNSHRSNLPYGEVADAMWASPPVRGVSELSVIGTDSDGRKVFSPRASMRGDLARDQFYFFTRYQADRPADYSLDNFRVSLPTLLKWHREDPVDDGERARNDAIVMLQGNRNPYVDRPSYVGRVGFDAALLRRRSVSTPID